MTSGNTVRLDFGSTLDLLDMVHAVTDHVARMAGLDEDASHSVCVAVRESVINAIKHGNGADPQKRVFLELTTLDAGSPGIAIRVRDEGPGFDVACLPDCRSPENVLKCSGRGVFLMRSFMDDVVMQRAPEGGMEVRMVKHLQDSACRPLPGESGSVVKA